MATLIANFRRPQKGILQEPDPLLKTVCTQVNNIDNEIKLIANKLTHTLAQLDRPYRPWLGLAAPQIGYSKRIVALKISRNKYMAMINPEVVEEKYRLLALSSCFSLTGLYLIKSPYWLKVRYMDLEGNKHQRIFRSGMAVMLHQEIDHINGRLINER